MHQGSVSQVLQFRHQDFTNGLIPGRHITYSSVANMNPFEEHYTQLREFIDPDHDKTPKAPPTLPSKAYKPPRMTESRSEGDIALHSGLSSSSSGSQFSHLVYSSDDDRIRLSEDTTASSTPSRGRSKRRAASPSKDLEDIQEAQPPSSPPSSTPKTPKRSRSPMKRIFGERGWLGKSMSMNELPSEEYRKTGIKHWGGKIKKGVGQIVRWHPMKTCTVLNMNRPKTSLDLFLGVRATHHQKQDQSLQSALLSMYR